MISLHMYNQCTCSYTAKPLIIDPLRSYITDKFHACDCSYYRNSTFGTSEKRILLYSGQWTASVHSRTAITTSESRQDTKTASTKNKTNILMFATQRVCPFLPRQSTVFSRLADSACCETTSRCMKPRDWGHGWPASQPQQFITTTSLQQTIVLLPSVSLQRFNSGCIFHRASANLSRPRAHSQMVFLT